MAKSHRNYSVIKLKDKRYITLYFRNFHFRTGYKVNDENDFNQKTHKFSSKWLKENQGAFEAIENFKLKVDSLIKEARSQGVNELEYTRRELNQENKNIKKINILDTHKLSEIYEDWIEIVTKNKRENSKKRYYTNLSKIKWYEKEKKQINLSHINEKFILDFITWMAIDKVFEQEITVEGEFGRTYDIKRKAKNTNITIKRWLSDLNTFLKWCSKNNKNLIFPHDEITQIAKELKTPSKDQEIIAMTMEQWEAFKQFEIPKNQPALQKTYDFYVFAVNTGMRSGDIKKLFSAYVIDKEIKMRATKTGVFFFVDMNKTAYKIYQKYNCDFRNVFPCVQQLNKNLRKILSKIPEFQHDDIKYQYVLNNIDEIQVKNYEKFTIHSARRTCTSFLALKKAPISYIMRTLGWVNTRMLENYLDILNAKNDKEQSYLNF